MDIIELVKEVRKDNRIIEHKIEELERLKTRCEATGISLEGERVSGSHNVSRVENSYLRYIEYKDELERYIQKALDKRKILMDLVDTLDKQQEIDVMYKYCLFNMTLLQIADIMSYSKPNVHKIYRKAIDTMQKRVNKSRQK